MTPEVNTNLNFWLDCLLTFSPEMGDLTRLVAAYTRALEAL
jgi:hypothetical protein